MPISSHHAVAFSRDDQLIAVGGRSGVIKVWQTATESKVSEFKAHRQRIRTIEFTAERQILSAGDDQVVRISTPEDPENNRSLPRQSSKFYAACLLEDGIFATGGSDNKIHLWRTTDLQPIGLLKGHTGTVTSLDFTGSYLVSGSYDTHVRLWSSQRHTSLRLPRETNLSGGWSQKLK